MNLTSVGSRQPARVSESNTLPRLLYVGDVPVEASYHGSALLFRLLQDYPSDRLVFFEAGTEQSAQERRLPAVDYRQVRLGGNRWRCTRISRFAGTWLIANRWRNAARLRKLLDGFDPQAVLTIAHGYSWLLAADLARQASLPLHLIVHDDWPTTEDQFPWLKPWQNREFGRVYREAQSRLCVSPFMEEEYRRRYGVAGQVLYPSRAKDCPVFEGVPNTYGNRCGQLVGAYAGNIFHRSYAELIAAVAQSLEGRGGRLLLFSPHSSDNLGALGLNRPNIIAQGLLSSGDLIRRLSSEADFVFAPMAFQSDAIRHNMQLSFPSKLADYTATGVPLLIWGPHYCSAVRWADRYAPIAEVVRSQESGYIDAAVHRLENAAYRERLGRAALAIGGQLFSHQSSVEILYEALMIRGAEGP